MRVPEAAGLGVALDEGQVPKYLNSPQSPVFDKSSLLYGLDMARPHIQRSGQVVIVEGVATQGSESRPFRASAGVDDVLEGGLPAVVGCELDRGAVQSDGIVTLDVRLSVWLDQVDFALVPASGDGSKVELSRDDNPHQAFVRGLKKAAAYAFSYAPNSAP